MKALPEGYLAKMLVSLGGIGSYQPDVSKFIESLTPAEADKQQEGSAAPSAIDYEGLSQLAFGAEYKDSLTRGHLTIASLGTGSNFFGTHRELKQLETLRKVSYSFLEQTLQLKARKTKVMKLFLSEFQKR